jgi:hypothetical protein
MHGFDQPGQAERGVDGQPAVTANVGGADMGFFWSSQLYRVKDAGRWRFLSGHR